MGAIAWFAFNLIWTIYGVEAKWWPWWFAVILFVLIDAPIFIKSVKGE